MLCDFLAVVIFIMSLRLVCIYRILSSFPIIAFAVGPQSSLDGHLFARESSGSWDFAPLPLDQLAFSPSPLANTHSLFQPELDSSDASGVDDVTWDPSESLFDDFTSSPVDQAVSSSLSPFVEPLTLPDDTDFDPIDDSEMEMADPESLFATDEDGGIFDDSSFLAGCPSSPVDKSRKRMRRDDSGVCTAPPTNAKKKVWPYGEGGINLEGVTVGGAQTILLRQGNLYHLLKSSLASFKHNVLCDLLTAGLLPWGLCSAAIGEPNTLLQVRDFWFFTMDYDPARIGTL